MNSTATRRIMLVSGARPNFIKIAPLERELRSRTWAEPLIVHTGQHYDNHMSDSFFEDLEIPDPIENLGVGSGTPTAQLAKIISKFESVLLRYSPDMVIVVGDVTSTLATSLVCNRNGVTLAHVEAGLRSFDRSMPEEINRILTDQLSDLLLVSEPAGLTNLSNEGVTDDKVHLVGNVMIDSVLQNLPKALDSPIHSKLGINNEAYLLATFHRPSNVDNVSSALKLLECMRFASKFSPVIVPLHPRTARSFERMGLDTKLQSIKNLMVIPPVGYFDSLALQAKAKAVLSDSGGVQEETTALGVPCLTLRENTERPITVNEGTSSIVGLSSELVGHHLNKIFKGEYKSGAKPDLWDGLAATRISDIIRRVLHAE